LIQIKMTPEITAALMKCPLFSKLNEAALRRLAAMASLKKYAKDELIFRQGDSPAGVFVIASGRVRVYNLNPNGKEHVLHLLSAGETFAEIAALGEFPCPAFAEALEKTVCVLLPTKPFNQALRADHQLCLQLLASLTAWVKHFVGSLEGIVLRDAAGRVAAYLLEAHAAQGPLISLPSLKKHVASHLNLTSETLSRTLRRLCDDDLIGVRGKNQVVIKDLAALRDIAEI
jgi:CRP/FNR family transcriptional regulator